MWNFYQNYSTGESDYQRSAMTYRPRLEFIGKPRVTDIAITSDSVRVINDTTEFVGHLKFIASIKVVNKEKYVAMLVAEVATDTLSGSDDLRQLILSKNERQKKIRILPPRDIFHFKEIAYLDTITLSIRHTVRHISAYNEGVLHFFVMYQNELGVLYDAYYWVKFSVNTIPLVIRNVPIEEQRHLPSARLLVARKDLANAIKFGESNTSQYIYKKSEKDDIFDFFYSKMENTKFEHHTFQISTKRTLIVSPATDYETWKVETTVSYSGPIAITNSRAFVWFDSLTTISKNPEAFVQPVMLNFDLVESHSLSESLTKAFITDFHQQGREIYKHCVVIFDDTRHRSYRAELTEKLVIKEKRAQWVVVRKTATEVQ